MGPAVVSSKTFIAWIGPLLMIWVQKNTKVMTMKILFWPDFVLNLKQETFLKRK